MTGACSWVVAAGVGEAGKRRVGFWTEMPGSHPGSATCCESQAGALITSMCLCFLVVGNGPVSILPSTVCGTFYVLGKPLVTTLLPLLLLLLISIFVIFTVTRIQQLFGYGAWRRLWTWTNGVKERVGRWEEDLVVIDSLLVGGLGMSTLEWKSKL